MVVLQLQLQLLILTRLFRFHLAKAMCRAMVVPMALQQLAQVVEMDRILLICGRMVRLLLQRLASLQEHILLLSLMELGVLQVIL